MSRLPPEERRPDTGPPPAGPGWEKTQLLPRPQPVRGNALPTGSHLAEFELLRVLGEGGFGIVYLAHDHSLQRRVAIKEYMPASLAMRNQAMEVVVIADKQREVFNAGLESFVNEARLLAQFDHPSLVKVYRFWRGNGTAYMVMPFYEGITLKERLRQQRTPPDERWLLALLGSLTEALAVIHAEHFLHRDIAPDNILLLADTGRPLLLDFGAARQVIGDATQALTAILKPGYAPVEQYAEIPSLKQGPWTDVYALCAVVYAALMGSKPPVSVGRTVTDSYVPLTQSAAGRCSEQFLAAIDAGLQVRPDARPPSVHALREALGLDSATLAHAAAPVLRAAAPPRPLPPAVAPVPAPAPAAVPPELPEPAPARARRWPWAVAGGLALALLAGAVHFLAPGRSPEASPSASTAVPPTGSASMAPPPVQPANPVTPAAFSLQGEFDRLLQASQADFQVQALPDRPQLRIGRDRLGFKVSSARAGHVYVMVAGPDGNLLLLYPNSMAPDSRIGAGQTVRLPQGSWPLDTAEPTGRERFVVLVSEHPRSFDHLSQNREAWFLRLPVGAAAEALAQGHRGPGSVLAGQARCTSPGCDRYGVAVFDVEVVR